VAGDNEGSQQGAQSDFSIGLSTTRLIPRDRVHSSVRLPMAKQACSLRALERYTVVDDSAGLQISIRLKAYCTMTHHTSQRLRQLQCAVQHF